MKNEELSQLILALNDPDSSVRRDAAKRLGKSARHEAVEPLCAALHDRKWQVRRNAAVALGKLGSHGASSALISALKDEVHSVRRDAAQSLGLLKAAEAVEPLCRALGDRRSSVRESARDALIRLGAPAVISLCGCLTSPDERQVELAHLSLEKILTVDAQTPFYFVLVNRTLTVPERETTLETLFSLLSADSWLNRCSCPSSRAVCAAA